VVEAVCAEARGQRGEFGVAGEIRAPVAGDDLIEKSQVVRHSTGDDLVGSSRKDDRVSSGAILMDDLKYRRVVRKKSGIETSSLRELLLQIRLPSKQPD